MSRIISDLSYTTAGLWTRFIPNTPAGEDVWREMETQGGAVVLSIHAKNVIGQIRKAGYSVAKAKNVAPLTMQDIDALLAELHA
jgi:hypothetical protein